VLERSAMTAPQIGKLLAVLNVVAIAAYQALAVAYGADVGWVHLADPSDAVDTFLVIAVAAFLPAAGIGAYLGWFAENLATEALDRFVLVAIQAVVFVILLGYLANWDALIAPACGSTLLFCWHLVRLTRTRQVIPVATLR
jgi:hypothetical protein